MSPPAYETAEQAIQRREREARATLAGILPAGFDVLPRGERSRQLAAISTDRSRSRAHRAAALTLEMAIVREAEAESRAARVAKNAANRHVHRAEGQPAEQAPPEKYRCTICGYVYDPEKGDPPAVQPWTAFQNLPDDWSCPNCRAPKDTFEPTAPNAPAPGQAALTLSDVATCRAHGYDARRFAAVKTALPNARSAPLTPANLTPAQRAAAAQMKGGVETFCAIANSLHPR